MAEILHFTPRESLAAEKNLTEFIRQCRDELTVFGADLDWSEDQWVSAGISFGNLDQKTRKLKPENLLRSPFKEFAKAYFRYQQGHRPTLDKQEMTALKCLERALVESTGDATVANTSGAVLDHAAAIARKHFSAVRAYQTGRQLARMATFLSDKHLIPGQLDWRNPNHNPPDTNRTGEKAKKAREQKLPDNEAIDALADIFASNPTEPRDIFTTSVVALLLCVPARVNEVLTLPADCEVYETKRDGNRAYGLRFQPGKGAEPQIKWVPASMETVAQEAISRLRLLTDEPRRLAHWFETNPSSFYRHEQCPDVAEDQPLTVTDACFALGLGTYDRHYAGGNLRRMKLPGRDRANSLGTLNQWAHTKLPESFPWFDEKRKIRFSQALCCLQVHQLHSDFSTNPIRLSKPGIGTINGDLGSSEKSPAKPSQTIFDRYGYNDNRSFPLRVTSHQFRHLLNTMSHRGGLSQAEIARWSGRVDVKQNRVYDHMSEFELVDMLREYDTSLSLGGSLQELADQIATKIPMTRQEFNTLSIPTAHLTEFGFCTHDFTMSPCQRHRDCLNCTEQVAVKGDRRLQGLYDIYQKTARLREQADQEIANGAAGADRWYEHLCRTEARVAELIEVMRNPQIANGAVVKLRNPEEFSPLRRAVEAKAANSGGQDGEQRVMLEDMRKLLGGEERG